MKYHLHKWALYDNSNPYAAPEISKCLRGFRDNETKQVVTSPIVEVNGNIVTTYSGSTYMLEDIDPEYLQWLKDRGYKYDPKYPIKTVLHLR